ncbi:MAG: DUF4199 domain-containing protein [Chitinophagaceae bacterium]
MEKTITSRVTKGVIIAGILIALDLILQNIYSPVPDGLRYMPRLIIVLLGVLLSCIIFSRQSGGQLSFGEVFSHGFKTTAVIAFIMAVYTFVAVKYIYAPPNAAEMAEAVKAIEQQGNALHEEAKQLAAKAAANRWIIYVSISIFASLIPGLLGSLAGAAITKKNQ